VTPGSKLITCRCLDIVLGAEIGKASHRFFNSAVDFECAIICKVAI